MVDTQAEFSMLWGKGPSWYSSSLARRREPSLESLVVLYVRLGDIIAETLDESRNAADPVDAESLQAGAKVLADVRVNLWSHVERKSRGYGKTGDI